MKKVENNSKIEVKNSKNTNLTNVGNISIQTEEVEHFLEIKNAFTVLHNKVELIPNGADKEIAKTAVKELELEASQGEKASEKVISKWLKFLLEVAPDAWEVAIDTFLNPIKGLSTVFKKVAEQSKKEQQTNPK
ncbi:MAG: hypothetical protein IPM31_13865 [Anaerolineae bacterium]|nr:hypothetical protein [Anaerolineae bacterium]MBL8107415.1 hypothetical protein [Anaerolineales bacterium]